MKEEMKLVRGKTLHTALVNLVGVHRRIARKAFDEVELTHGQPKILDFLITHDGCIQKEIADYCDVKAATVTSLLNVMEKAGLIERRPNPTNRRVLRVFLTDKGREKQAVVGEVFGDIEDACFEGFSQEEKQQVLGYLERMCENIRGKEEADV